MVLGENQRLSSTSGLDAVVALQDAGAKEELVQASGGVHRLMSWGGDGPLGDGPLLRVEAVDRLTGVEGLPQGNGGRIPEWSLRNCVQVLQARCRDWQQTVGS